MNEKTLDEMACEMVGDGKKSNMFFVSYKGEVITATRNFDLAYNEWLSLSTRQESALEDRFYGTIAGTEPESDEENSALRTFDDSDRFKAFYLRS